MNGPHPDWKTSYLALVGLLVRRRKELGLSQEHVAVQLRAGLRTFHRWEAGRAMPPSARLFQWAAALGVEIAPHVAHSHPTNREPMRQSHCQEQVAEAVEKRVAQALEQSRLQSLELAKIGAALSSLPPHLREEVLK